MRMALGLLAVGAVAAAGWTAGAIAQEGAIYFPSLVYRSGPYAPNGIPWANGAADYVALVNARDGGINGVKIQFEECETGYSTDRGVECYERLKTGGGKGAVAFAPLSTGITFALTEKAPGDKIPLQTMGYGRSESADGSVFQWNFPLLGTYWSAADILIQHFDKTGGLKGKKVILIYHDSPYGKEPIPVLQDHAKTYGYELELIPITPPGVEQKSAWLQVRRSRPDYVALWGWGVMNSTAIKEAVAVGFPLQKMFGVWWAGAEPDVEPAGADAKGYNALAMNPSGTDFEVIQAILTTLYDQGRGAGNREDVGDVLYNRGMIDAMLRLEGVRTAMAKFGNRPVSGEEVRWGLENLKLDEAAIEKLGFTGLIRPVQVTCADHEGSRSARIHQWDCQKWAFVSDWIEADRDYLRPKVEAAAAAYAKEKGITPVSCS